MPPFGMQHAMQQLILAVQPAADARAYRQIQAAVQTAGCAQANLGQRGGVYIGIAGKGHV